MARTDRPAKISTRARPKIKGQDAVSWHRLRGSERVIQARSRDRPIGPAIGWCPSTSSSGPRAHSGCRTEAIPNNNPQVFDLGVLRSGGGI